MTIFTDYVSNGFGRNVEVFNNRQNAVRVLRSCRFIYTVNEAGKVSTETNSESYSKDIWLFERYVLE